MTNEETLAYLMAVSGVTETRQTQVNITDDDMATKTVAKFGPHGRVEVYHYSDGPNRVMSQNRGLWSTWHPLELTAGALDVAVKWALAPMEMET